MVLHKLVFTLWIDDVTESPNVQKYNESTKDALNALASLSCDTIEKRMEIITKLKGLVGGGDTFR